MRTLKMLMFLSLLICGPFAAGADKMSGDGAGEFIKQNMIGKQLHAETNRKIDQGKVATDFSVTITYANWSERPNGFEFDVISDVKQTMYDLDKNGEKILPGISKDRIAVNRCLISKIKSTGQLLGIVIPVSNSLIKESAAGPTSLQLGMQDGKLVMKTASIFHGDRFAAGNQVKPGASERTNVLEVKDGKLHSTSRTQSFDVDPTTLARTPDGELRIMEMSEKK